LSQAAPNPIKSGAIRGRATIAGAYTADFAEAPLGSMRLKRANEGAIRASITQFLDRLRTMK
jgi:hypothetical protein